MTTTHDLRQPGAEGDRTPVGFLPHADISHTNAAIHVEAVIARGRTNPSSNSIYNYEINGKVYPGGWSDESDTPFVRVVLGTSANEGLATGWVDLTREQAQQLIYDLQDQVRRL